MLKAFGLEGKSSEDIKAFAGRLQQLEAVEQDPFAYLDARRPNWFQDATNRQLGRSVKPTVEQQIEAAKREAVETVRKEQRETELKRQALADQQAAQQLLDSAANFVESNAEKYELIRAEDAQVEVGNLILLHWQRTGALLTLEESADAVEAHLAERWQEKVLKTKKVQAWIKPAPAGDEVARPPSSMPEATGPKTINSQMHASSVRSDDGTKRLSESEQWSAWKRRIGV